MTKAFDEAVEAAKAYEVVVRAHCGDDDQSEPMEAFVDYSRKIDTLLSERGLKDDQTWERIGDRLKVIFEVHEEADIDLSDILPATEETF